MPVLADDDVVVHGDAERGGDIDDRLGHLDVGLRRRRVAGGMVVQETMPLLSNGVHFGFLRSKKQMGTSIGDCKQWSLVILTLHHGHSCNVLVDHT